MKILNKILLSTYVILAILFLVVTIDEIFGNGILMSFYDYEDLLFQGVLPIAAIAGFLAYPRSYKIIIVKIIPLLIITILFWFSIILPCTAEEVSCWMPIIAPVATSITLIIAGLLYLITFLVNKFSTKNRF